MKKTIQKSVIAITTLVVMALMLPTSTMAQDATKVDSKHYSVEFENDEIRVLKIKYGPGETSVMHYHPRGYVFFVTDYEISFKIPNGDIIEASGKAGQSMWSDAGQHLPTNIGKNPLEVLQVEFKTKPMKSKKKHKQ